MKNIRVTLKNMDKKVKTILFIVVVALVILILISLAMSIKNLMQRTKISEDAAGLKTTYVDENSGETVTLGQKTPEVQDIPGAPTVYGLTNLIKRGLSYDNARLVKSVIEGKYASINNSGDKEQIERVSIAKTENIEHSKTPDGLHVYKAKFVINDTDDNILQITTDGGDYLQVYVGKDDSSLELFYSSK